MRTFIILVLLLTTLSLFGIQTEQVTTVPGTGLSKIVGTSDHYSPIAPYRPDVAWQAGDEAAIGERVKASATGPRFMVGWTLNNERIAMHTETATPIWNYPLGDTNFVYPITMREDGSLCAFSQDATLTVSETGNGTPVWITTMPGGSIIQDIAIHPTTQTIFLTTNNSSTTTTDLSAYTIGNDTPLWSVNMPGTAQSLVLSGDGSTLLLALFGSVNNLYGFDTTDGAMLLDVPFQNQNPPAISHDGSGVVTGDYSGWVRYYRRNDAGTGYDEQWNYRVFAGTSGYSPWVGGMAISGDGSTIACGSLIFESTGYNGEIYLFDSTVNQPLWVCRNVGDYVLECDLSDDGSMLAAGGYGPLDHNGPDFFLFRRASATPVYVLNTPGSLMSLDLSGDGTVCAAGFKAVHAREMGSGGMVYGIDSHFGGGTLRGQVSLNLDLDLAGTRVTLTDLDDYSTYTDNNGNYCFLYVPSDAHLISVQRTGFTTVSDVAMVEEGQETIMNFDLVAVGNPPGNLQCGQDLAPSIPLTWQVSEQTTACRIYRKTNAGLPWNAEPHYEVTVTGPSMSFTDTAVQPLTHYFYAVSGIVGDNLETPMSAVAEGWTSSGFITATIDAWVGTQPNIDGLVDPPSEWEDAFRVDLSDYHGNYDSHPNPVNSVPAWFKINESMTRLNVLAMNYNDTVFEDHDEVALYIDDNGDGTYPQSGGTDMSEGNYWAIHWAAGDQVRYRPLLSPSGTGEVLDLTAQQAQVAVSEDTGLILYEFSLPIGDEYWAIQPGEDMVSRLFVFVLDDPDMFDGYWPHTNQDVFDPAGYGLIRYGSEDTIPPAPHDLAVASVNGNRVTLGWECDPVNDLLEFRIFCTPPQGEVSLIGTSTGHRFQTELTEDGLYLFTVQTADQAGHESALSLPLEYGHVVQGTDPGAPALTTALLGNMPNPFNPTTTIRYSLDSAQSVDLTVFNIRGQKVRTLVKTHQPAGRFETVWDGTDDGGTKVSTGVYFTRLSTRDKTSVGKMLLLK